MNDRYTQRYRLPDNLYAHGAPIIIAAGALLKDNDFGRILGQLKFRNICSKCITAIKVSITAYDVSGMAIGEPILFQYLDLNIEPNEYAGSKVPISLPDETTNSFAANVTAVFFADGVSWDGAKSEWTPLPMPKILVDNYSNPQLLKQFYVDNGNNCVFVPTISDDLWLCTCGSWNQESATHCGTCNKDKQQLLGSLDESVLQESLEMRLKEETRLREAAEQRELALAAAAAEKKEKIKTKVHKYKWIICIVLAVAIIGLAFALWIYPDVIRPNEEKSKAYSAALALYNDKSYCEACDLFNQLDSYKHSGDLAQECRDKLEENGLYNVLDLFPKIDYGISPEALYKTIGKSECTGSYMYRSYTKGSNYINCYYKYGNNFVLNNISSEAHFQFYCDSSNKETGHLYEMTWLCPDNLANYNMYLQLKEYITGALGAPSGASTPESTNGKINSDSAYWGDMQLSYSTAGGTGSIKLSRNSSWIDG